MADVKFTEGPWVARELEPRSDWWTVEGADTVCDLYHLDEATHERIRHEEPCTEANAHLIAASPDLHRTGSDLANAISALLPLVDHEIEQRKCGGNDEDWAELDAIWKSANAALIAHRAALAKAEGQS